LRLRDVTDEPQAMDLASEQSRFVSLAEALPVGVLSADTEDFLVFANDAATGFLGVEFERLRGRGWIDRIHPDQRDDVQAAIAQARSRRHATRATFTVAAPSDPSFLQILVVPLTEAGRDLGWVATLEDVTARLTAERELAHRATHDPLTGLPNRWLLMDRLQQALAKCARRQGGVAVVFVDIDRLKAHNDAHGHAAGDAALIHAARRLSGNLRPSDTAARIGGDEFVVVSDVHDEREARDLARRLQTLLDDDLAHGQVTLHVTASVGVAFTDDPTVTPAQLLADADAAMYRHKST
jgi:diguanylate cyclase (GGDEF)-like protein/PAS domain S-box-containing protein